METFTYTHTLCDLDIDKLRVIMIIYIISSIINLLRKIVDLSGCICLEKHI